MLDLFNLYDFKSARAPKTARIKEIAFGITNFIRIQASLCTLTATYLVPM